MKKKPLKAFKLTIIAVPGSEFQEEFLGDCLRAMGRASLELESYHKKNWIDMEFETGTQLSLTTDSKSFGDKVV